jgi:hypothetical protein
MDKLLNCKLAYSNQMNDNLRLKLQILTNSQIILAKLNNKLLGLTTFYKRCGNGVFIVAVKSTFYTVTLTLNGDERKHLVWFLSLNRLNWYDLNKNNYISTYNNLLNSNFIWEAYRHITRKKGANAKSIGGQILNGFSDIGVNHILKDSKKYILKFK